MRASLLVWFLPLLPMALSLASGEEGEIGLCPLEAVAADGRYYVVVVPSHEGNARYSLARRSDGLPDKPPGIGVALSRLPGRHVALDPREEVLASGTCRQPGSVICLPGGQGLVLCDTPRAFSDRNRVALTHYDGEGRKVWSRRLSELFSEPELDHLYVTLLGGFLWELDLWVDGDRITIVYDGASQLRLRQLLLADGSLAETNLDALARRITEPDWTGKEDFVAAWAALENPSRSAIEAARRSWARSRTPQAQAAIAVLLAEQGDPGAKAFLVEFLNPPACTPLRWRGRFDEPGPLGIERSAFAGCAFALKHSERFTDLATATRLAERLRDVPSYDRLAQFKLAAWSDTGLDSVIEGAVQEGFNGGGQNLAWLRGDFFNAHRPTEELMEQLRRALDRLGPEERVWIVRGCSALHSEVDQALPVLTRALEDPDPNVRAAGVLVLCKLDPQRRRWHVAELGAATETPDTSFGGRATSALNELADELKAEGKPTWWIVLLGHLDQLAQGGLALAVWYLTAWFLPWRRRRSKLALGLATALVAGPPIALCCFEIHRATSRAWAEPFMGKSAEFMLLEPPAIAMLSVSLLCALLGSLVALRRYPPRAAPAELLGQTAH